MRAVAIFVVAGFLGINAAQAQSLPGGPLSSAAPAATPQTPVAKPGKVAKAAHPKIVRYAKAHDTSPSTDVAKAKTPAVDVPVARRSSTEDNPLSLGMKWNGNNDSSTQTRVQNYGGDASGTGAAVGLKLHF